MNIEHPDISHAHKTGYDRETWYQMKKSRYGVAYEADYDNDYADTELDDDI